MKAIQVDAAGIPVAVMPDSVITPNKRPWFVPDFGGDWYGRPLLAVRIGRLGKGIKPQFAHRYIDAVTVAVHPVCSDKALNPVELLIMDGALILGDWGEASSMPFRLSGYEMAVTDSEMSHALEVCSLHATLKTGDIILLPVEAPDIPLVSGVKLRAENGQGGMMMSVNVK